MRSAQYRPGDTAVHRLAPGSKLAALVVVSALPFLLPRLDLAALLLACVAALFRLAQVPWRVALLQLRPIAGILVALFATQLVLKGWMTAGLVAVRLAAVLWLASLVTLTTRSAEVADAIETSLAWLRPFGLSPAKVGLAISLTLRFVPVLAAVTAEVREAQRVRGLDRSFLGLAVPVLVRTLRTVDDVADAIEARAWDPARPTIREGTAP